MRGGIYTLYNEKRGLEMHFREKTKQIGRIPAKKVVMVQIILLWYIWELLWKCLLVFFCNENWANFHCHRPKIVCSLLFLLRATTSITQPPYRPPYESSCCILTLTPLSLLRIAFSPLHSRREKRAHFQGQRRHDFVEERFIWFREKAWQAKGVNFGGRAF